MRKPLKTRKFSKRVGSSAVAAAQFPDAAMLCAQFPQPPFIAAMAGAINQIGHIDNLFCPVIAIRPTLGNNPASMGNGSYFGKYRIGKSRMPRISMSIKKNIK